MGSYWRRLVLGDEPQKMACYWGKCIRRKFTGFISAQHVERRLVLLVVAGDFNKYTLLIYNWTYFPLVCRLFVLGSWWLENVKSSTDCKWQSHKVRIIPSGSVDDELYGSCSWLIPYSNSRDDKTRREILVRFNVSHKYFIRFSCPISTL